MTRPPTDRPTREDTFLAIFGLWIVVGSLATIETLPDGVRLVLFFLPALVLVAALAVSKY